MPLTDLIEPIWGDRDRAKIALLFHLAVAIIVLVVVFVFVALLSRTRSTPTQPTGWGSVDFPSRLPQRLSITDYLDKQSVPDTTPMVRFGVATANFGAIFTENIGALSPWIGSVNPEAARLQVEGGARAIVFDIWPDPADPERPVVAAMVDNNRWSTYSWWLNNGGMNQGMGRYSNWQRLTRNVAPVGECLRAAVDTAFGQTNPQRSDPFFLILRLHGAFKKTFLHRLGQIVEEAVAGHQMGAEWNKANNQRALCTEPVRSFMNRVFTIVIPDIQTGVNILPGVNTLSKFVPVLLDSKLGEYTNAVEQTPNTMFFDPGSAATITAASQPPCGPQQTGGMIPLPEAGFVVVQPSVGGQTTTNDGLFAPSSYTAELATGAQFVAINMFSPNDSEGPMTTFLRDDTFGVHSFRLSSA
jgi:hypothetical protein